MPITIHPSISCQDDRSPGQPVLLTYPTAVRTNRRAGSVPGTLLGSSDWEIKGNKLAGTSHSLWVGRTLLTSWSVYIYARGFLREHDRRACPSATIVMATAANSGYHSLCVERFGQARPISNPFWRGFESTLWRSLFPA